VLKSRIFACKIYKILQHRYNSERQLKNDVVDNNWSLTESRAVLQAPQQQQQQQ